MAGGQVRFRREQGRQRRHERERKEEIRETSERDVREGREREMRDGNERENEKRRERKNESKEIDMDMAYKYSSMMYIGRGHVSNHTSFSSSRV